MRGRVPPKLDDRSFEQLRQEAIQQLHAACPGWTDFSPSDPGIALVEAFAYLTQVMLYRLNRVPDKQYNAFLRLIGITPLPPAAATTTLVFERSGAGADRITIPAGTRAAAGAVQFTTVRAVRLEGTAKQVEVPAFHGEVIENELVGKGSGAAGLEVRVGKPPVVAPMSDGLDLVVAVEETEAIPAEARAVTIGTKTFRVWSEVANFANLRGEDHVFTVDRRAGIIRFGPAAEISDERGELRQGATPLGSVPPQNREIRVSYRTGGGAGGNVAAGSITTLRDAIPGVTVTNPTPGTGGRDEESFDNALIRGPTDFHRLERAVTARDVETLARRSSGVARAKAFTKSEFWKYAKPGIIEVRLVPTLGSDASALRPAVGELRPQATDELEKVLAALDNARPLGSSGEVGWTNLKTVSVNLEVVVSRQEDRIALERRVSDRLYKLITPLPRSAWDDGWPYGRALRRYDVEGAIRAEPGVLYTNRVELVADEMPEGQITSIAIDEHQPRTWYAGCGPTLYRTVNGGDGWEAMHDFTTGDGSADEVVSLVRGSRKYPGRIAAVTRFTDINHALVTKLYHSEDCGETWTFVNRSSFRVRDLAWADRNGVPLLYLATDGGLWEVLLNAAAGPVQVPVTNKADQASRRSPHTKMSAACSTWRSRPPIWAACTCPGREARMCRSASADAMSESSRSSARTCAPFCGRDSRSRERAPLSVARFVMSSSRTLPPRDGSSSRMDGREVVSWLSGLRPMVRCWPALIRRASRGFRPEPSAAGASPRMTSAFPCATSKLRGPASAIAICTRFRVWEWTRRAPSLRAPFGACIARWNRRDGTSRSRSAASFRRNYASSSRFLRRGCSGRASTSSR